MFVKHLHAFHRFPALPDAGPVAADKGDLPEKTDDAQKRGVAVIKREHRSRNKRHDQVHRLQRCVDEIQKRHPTERSAGAASAARRHGHKMPVSISIDAAVVGGVDRSGDGGADDGLEGREAGRVRFHKRLHLRKRHGRLDLMWMME